MSTSQFLDVGTDFALRTEFDDIRNYIRGVDIRHPERRAQGQLAVDTRFVRALPFGTTPPVPAAEHAVTIVYNTPKLYAFVTLYEKHSFLVELASITLNEAIFATHEFSSVRRGHQALDLEAMYARLSSDSGQ